MTGDDGLERYRVISTLGTGGMATVLLAEDLRLGRQVALKRLAGDVAFRHARGRQSNRTLNSRLRREALLGASVSHPNLVSIYDIVSTDDGGLVIVMEYVEGENLRDRMLREGRMPPGVALPILHGVAGGLDAIHSRGIVHRDLKPANVLLGDQETVKLADFGIATGAESTRITSEGAVVGTFRYMAPEQLEDAPSSPAMDIYALAVVALEMLSGQKARPESNPIALAHALATQPPPDLRMAWPEAPATVAELLARGMARDPSQRPQRAGDLVARLQAALEDATTRQQERPMAKRAATEPAAGPAMAEGEPPRRSPPAGPAGAAVERAPEPLTGPTPASTVGEAPPSAAEVRPRADHPRRRAAGASPNRRRLAAPIALLALLAAGGAVAAVITSGSSGSSPTSKGPSAASRTPAASRPPAASRTPAAANTSHARASSHPGATKTSTSTTASSSSSTTGTAAALRGATNPSASTDSTSGAASTPVQAVESFYHLAADHRYAQAWVLADSNFRDQLNGYQSFEAGQADDRSITFNKATVTNQTASSATVAVQTTSVRNSGTESCAGSVDLVKNGTTWQLDQIGINCS